MRPPRKAIKEAKLLKLEQIRIFPDTLSRQSLAKLVEQGKMKAAQEQVAELMASMKAVGQIELVGVKQIDVPEELLKEDGIVGGLYYLVFGLRRYLAAHFLGWDTIKASILK